MDVQESRKIMYQITDAAQTAIQALDKQIPKKVKRIGSTQLRCVCGAIIRMSRYCPYCGQKLDWEKKNEKD